jgi:hypothetical protein
MMISPFEKVFYVLFCVEELVFEFCKSVLTVFKRNLVSLSTLVSWCFAFDGRDGALRKWCGDVYGFHLRYHHISSIDSLIALYSVKAQYKAKQTQYQAPALICAPMIANKIIVICLTSLSDKQSTKVQSNRRTEIPLAS